jgi:hypothetical protein
MAFSRHSQVFTTRALALSDTVPTYLYLVPGLTHSTMAFSRHSQVFTTRALAFSDTVPTSNVSFRSPW